MNHFIVDAVALPPGGERWLTEKIVRLPHSYQANDDRRAIIADTRSRRGWLLPERGFVFCCFNHTYKIDLEACDIWMRLLDQVEGSTLWLLRSNLWAEENLRREAAARGVDPARQVFSPGVLQGKRPALADLVPRYFRRECPYDRQRRALGRTAGADDAGAPVRRTGDGKPRPRGGTAGTRSTRPSRQRSGGTCLGPRSAQTARSSHPSRSQSADFAAVPHR